MFNTKVDLLVSNFILYLKTGNDVPITDFAYRLDLNAVLLNHGILQVTKPFIEDLSFLKNDSSKLTYPTIIKIDLFHQEISPKYFQRQHFRHNTLLYGFKNGSMQVVEHEFGGSHRFVMHSFTIGELNRMYQGYLDYYYHSGLDTGDTIAMYIPSNSLNAQQVIDPRSNFLMLLQDNQHRAKQNIAILKSFFGRPMALQAENFLSLVNTLIWLKSVTTYQFKHILPEAIQTIQVLHLQSKALRQLKLLAVSRNLGHGRFEQNKELSDFLYLEERYVELTTSLASAARAD